MTFAAVRTGSVQAPRTQAPPARVVITGVEPRVDCGRYAAKRIAGECVTVEADVLADGHDLVRAALLWRRAERDGGEWASAPMEPLGNDRFRGAFTPPAPGEYEFAVEGWVDRFGSWRRDLERRVSVGQSIGVDLRIGAAIVREATKEASRTGADTDARRLEEIATVLEGDGSEGERSVLAAGAEATALMDRWGPREGRARTEPLRIIADRVRARFGAWYELFPRSFGPDDRTHGTLRDVARLVPRLAGMGFDVLYLPPIHPIGRTFRKGRNNAERAEPGDVGSPWAIGGPEGGHTAVHPQLGTLEDFDALVAVCKEHGMEVALDLALQCSPDHPWVKEHPEWFRHRPDGTIQYAENPPKRYQDIYPLDFGCEGWRGLWEAVLGVVRFWCGHGVRIFRVDNPHTKPLALWEWLIAEVREEHPEAIFLSEAFTRPKVMKELAKLGFTQSYTYFTWRNTKRELEEYFTELTRTEMREYFRASLWPNTPDILHEHLQQGGRAACVERLILAATLGATYGIYGPPLETCDVRAREPGSEEYRNSEKYQLRHWDLDAEGTLGPLIARINRIRRENPALQRDDTLVFHRTESEDLICYSKSSPDLDNVIVCAVNLNPWREVWGTVELDMAALGMEAQEDRTYQMHDLLTDARYTWRGARNVVGLNPASSPAHIFRVRRRARSEHEFEYYL